MNSYKHLSEELMSSIVKILNEFLDNEIYVIKNKRRSQVRSSLITLNYLLESSSTDFDKSSQTSLPLDYTIEYIIGTDADTILDVYCTHQLLKKLSTTDPNTVGIVGFVDIAFVSKNNMNSENQIEINSKWNPLVMYQYAEYLYAQCLKRNMQSSITNKVSCLSGCVQLIKVVYETCGDEILNEFNRLPKRHENIFNHIRSYASEDRNHACLMFKLYPYVETVQAINAIAYTHVPLTFKALFRQRKRWCVGASCNDMLLIWNKSHNLWERINSLSNVMMFALTPFIFVATVEFIIDLILQPTYLQLILSSIMIIPFLYILAIPILIYNLAFMNIIYYYLCVLMYYTVGRLLSISIYFYQSLLWVVGVLLNSDRDFVNNSNKSNFIV
jgi:chitin synthase